MDWSLVTSRLEQVYDALIEQVRSSTPRCGPVDKWFHAAPSGHYLAYVRFDGSPPIFHDHWDLLLSFICNVSGAKDAFYRPDGTWAFPYGQEGDALQLHLSTPQARDPNGDVDIVALLPPSLLPGAFGSTAYREAVEEYLRQALDTVPTWGPVIIEFLEAAKD